MSRTSLLLLVLGTFLFSLSIINAFSADIITQPLQRAELLSCLSSVLIIGIASLWIRLEPNKPKKVDLLGIEGIFIDNEISNTLQNELAWGSQLILTATPAATILIYWNKKTILKRGLISNSQFIPGRITLNALKKDKLIVLSNTKNYPDSYEFDKILPNIPSLIIYPLANKGIVFVGGWSPRCFSKSDELWIKGWSQKVLSLLNV